MTNRIKNIERLKQAVSFDGFEYAKSSGKNIFPTDVDMFLEFGNAGYVIVEFKFGNFVSGMTGQLLGFERLAKDLWASDKKAILMVAVHQMPVGSLIIAKDADVAAVYLSPGRWLPVKNRKLKGFIDSFVVKEGLGNPVMSSQQAIDAGDDMVMRYVTGQIEATD